MTDNADSSETLLVKPGKTDKLKSHARWQITARDTGHRVRQEDCETDEKGRSIVKIDPSPQAGYFFQYNGHTAFLLNLSGGALSYRVEPDIEGLTLKGRQITFNTVTVRLRVPPGAREADGVTHGLEQDDLEAYKVETAGQADVYRMRILEGAKFFLTGSKSIPGDILHGPGLFRLTEAGNVIRILRVRPSESETTRDIDIIDAHSAGRTEKRKPIIIANKFYWIADHADVADDA